MANIPHCYEEMICMPTGAQFMAVIDDADSESCDASQDYNQNSCRNVVTLNEILNGAYTETLKDYTPVYGKSGQDSVKMREYCLRNAMGIDMADVNGSDDKWTIRNWKAGSDN